MSTQSYEDEETRMSLSELHTKMGEVHQKILELLDDETGNLRKALRHPTAAVFGHSAKTRTSLRSCSFVANVYGTNDILVVFVDNDSVANSKPHFGIQDLDTGRIQPIKGIAISGSLEEMDTIYWILQGLTTGFGYEPDPPLWIQRKWQRSQ